MTASRQARNQAFTQRSDPLRPSFRGLCITMVVSGVRLRSAGSSEPFVIAYQFELSFNFSMLISARSSSSGNTRHIWSGNPQKFISNLKQYAIKDWPMSSQYLHNVNHIGSTHGDRVPRHPPPLATIVIHSRQVWNHHYYYTFRARIAAPLANDRRRLRWRRR